MSTSEGRDKIYTLYEQKLLRALADGYSTKEIARHVDKPSSTMNKRIFTLYAKMGARNRSNAVHLAHQWGILS